MAGPHAVRLIFLDMSQPRPKPFQLSIPDNVLQDLRERLSRARLPDEPRLDPWATGASVAYMQRLIGYWRDGFDWRVQEAMLNQEFKESQGKIH